MVQYGSYSAAWLTGGAAQRVQHGSQDAERLSGGGGVAQAHGAAWIKGGMAQKVQHGSQDATEYCVAHRIWCVLGGWYGVADPSPVLEF
jgi:hypothetical protein